MTTNSRWLTTLALLLSCAGLAQAAQPTDTSPVDNGKMLVYIGTYAAEDEDGIHLCQLDMDSGDLKRIAAVQGIKNPSFQTLHPNQRYLYSVSESLGFQGQRSGSVSAFAIDPDSGMLKFLNAEPSLGTSPCHVATDRQGENLLVANYSSGSLAVLPIKSDGSLDIAHNLVQHKGASVHPRQAGPHAHCINLDAQNRFALSADLGLDKVMIYRYSRQDHSLTPNRRMPGAQVTPGAGPRHFTFHPSGKFGYVINELNSTVTAFAYNVDHGTLTTLQNISTLPDGFTGENTTAEVFVSPDGRFLYGSNRGHHSIVVFAIDSESGKLTLVSHHSTQGEQPRNFGIDPTGSFLLAANQRTGNVVVFRIDQPTGKLTPTGHRIQLKQPVCVTFLQQ